MSRVSPTDSRMRLVCPACFGERFEAEHLIENCRVKTCNTCGLRVLVEPEGRDKRSVPEFSRIDEAAYHRAITAVRQRQATAIISFVRGHQPPGNEWLDVGCGFGFFLLDLKREGFSVFGVEPDAKAFAHAQQLLGDALVYHGTMTSATRPDHSADVVSTLDVLEHIPVNMLSAFARMIHKKLSPGGLWLIKVPSTDGLYFTFAHQVARLARPLVAGVIKRLWQLEYEFSHTVYFNERSLTQYLNNHGFQPVDAIYLEEVPNETVRDRLRIDRTIPGWQGAALAPVFYAINMIERWRRKSDAMVMLARRVQIE